MTAKIPTREKNPARAFHTRRGKRENSGPAASSRQNSQPSANVGVEPVDGCMSFVSSSVIDAAKVRCAEHERSVHQRDCQPNSAERCKTGGASLALCFASILTKSTHWPDQRPPVSHASVSSLTLPRACHASLYCWGLRFSPLSIAPPGTVHAFGCGEPSTLRGEPCVTSHRSGIPPQKGKKKRQRFAGPAPTSPSSLMLPYSIHVLVGEY